MDRLPPQRARDHRRRHGAQLPALMPPGSYAAEPPGPFRTGRGPGLNTAVSFDEVLLAVAMWLGRFGVVLPVVALAGVVAAKRRVPAGAGTLATATPLFSVLLVGFVIILGALTFFPASRPWPWLQSSSSCAWSLAISTTEGRRRSLQGSAMAAIVTGMPRKRAKSPAARSSAAPWVASRTASGPSSTTT
jgi:potassium-transporting ATPase A subunit